MDAPCFGALRAGKQVTSAITPLLKGTKSLRKNERTWADFSLKNFGTRKNGPSNIWIYIQHGRIVATVILSCRIESSLPKQTHQAFFPGSR
jgi:hypothetical protein